jgi:subtilisin
MKKFSMSEFLGPVETGRHFVRFSKNYKTATAVKRLKSSTGVSTVLSSEFDESEFTVASALKAEGAIFFEEINVALVGNHDLGASALHALADEPGIEAVRPEYYVFGNDALEERFRNWLREGILILGDQVLQGPMAARAPEASVAQETDNATWGLNATKVPGSKWSGKGVKIAILDTGLDQDHPDFAERSDITYRNFAGGESADDISGHGTHCAGTAAGPLQPVASKPRYGVAHEAGLFIGKVLGNTGRGVEGDVLAGMSWAIRQGCDIISMSLGRPAKDSDGKPDSYYERMGRFALDKGTLVIAASGNSSRRPVHIAPADAPANAPSILSVAAVDQNMRPAIFSNGGKVDIAAPGVAIFSSWTTPLCYNTVSGTSMAVPHVAGIAALFAQSDNSLRGKRLWNALTHAALDIGLSREDGGAGLVQAPDEASANGTSPMS